MFIDALFNGLMNHQTIRVLKLNLCLVGDSGCENVSTFLEGNRSLKVLSLVDNGIGPIGYRYLADSLKINYSLESPS